MKAVVQRSVRKFSFAHVKASGSTPRLAYSTTLVVLLWRINGLAWSLYNAFLPVYLHNAGVQADDDTVYTTYRNYVIISVPPSFPSLPNPHHRSAVSPVPSQRAS